MALTASANQVTPMLVVIGSAVVVTCSTCKVRLLTTFAGEHLDDAAFQPANLR